MSERACNPQTSAAANSVADYEALINGARYALAISDHRRSTESFRAIHCRGKQDTKLSTLRVRFEEFDNVTHGKHALSCIVRNLATKFVLEAQGELDSVEAIGSEIIDEIIVFCYLIPIDTEMFGDDLLNRSLILLIVFQRSFLSVEVEALFCALREGDQVL